MQPDPQETRRLSPEPVTGNRGRLGAAAAPRRQRDARSPKWARMRFRAPFGEEDGRPVVPLRGEDARSIPGRWALGAAVRSYLPPHGKADVKAERSSKLPDDVKGGVDCGVDAGESADVEIRHDLPGVFTGNGAAHGQNFKSSAKSEPPTELPGCREWVVSRAQRRVRVTQTDGGLHGATAGRGAHEHSGRIWIENTGELGGHRGDDLCGRASERRELLREKVPQLLNDPFESIDCPSEDTEVRGHMAPWAVL
ncbi:hypothetical protein MJG53_003783 [Ovis ammon polii x Ovis aries]|uniref:Uncharacterized protein n=1 Tax=Ovis ammon polii x Ovis aries TaxID=2918886 RepID=A0ACB9V968_9CETA|nr:hypothetical protein MJG53_003783 [Ovis ammon polii x Ovis aries]